MNGDHPFHKGLRIWNEGHPFHVGLKFLGKGMGKEGPTISRGVKGLGKGTQPFHIGR